MPSATRIKRRGGTTIRSAHSIHTLFPPSAAMHLFVLASLLGAAVAQQTTVSSVSAAPTTAAPPASSTPFTPLASRRFEYTALPYQADTDTGARGRQAGYNLCNSTTEGPTSLCQTAMINSIDDFCLWGPPEPNSTIGDTEGEAVAWCTKPGRGTRLIPSGALTGVQFMRTSAYVQVTGRINQVHINIAADDGGGEMDPHGADRRGNPLGGLVFSNAFPSNAGRTDNYQQVIEWHNFMGDGIFCLKACDPAGPDADRYCEHVYDRIGCWRNAPAAYAVGVFETCEGETQDFPGVYTGTDGVVSTWSQPPESLGPITTVPYEPRIPASSNCVKGTSSAIYSALPSGTVPVSSSGTPASSVRSSSSSRASSGTAASATATQQSGASTSKAGITTILLGISITLMACL